MNFLLKSISLEDYFHISVFIPAHWVVLALIIFSRAVISTAFETIACDGINASKGLVSTVLLVWMREIHINCCSLIKRADTIMLYLDARTLWPFSLTAAFLWEARVLGSVTTERNGFIDPVGICRLNQLYGAADRPKWISFSWLHFQEIQSHTDG